MILAFFFKRAVQVVVDILELSGNHVVVKGNVVQVVPPAPCNIDLDFPVQALVDILQPSATCVVATYQSRRDLRTTYEHFGICFSPPLLLRLENSAVIATKARRNLVAKMKS